MVSNRFLIITVLFITCLMTANIIGSKIIAFGYVNLPVAVIIFPFSYIFGDVLTEVYGYHQARRVIWLGFLCNLIFVVFAYVGQKLPPDPEWLNQSAYETILGYTPRLLAASFIGYFVGEFANSFILVKMKLFTNGKWLWSRTIGSTIIGQGFDTAIYLTGAYWGEPFFTPMMILYHWSAKVIIEIVATPITYRVVNSLKKRENIDAYDISTNFNPFILFSKVKK